MVSRTLSGAFDATGLVVRAGVVRFVRIDVRIGFFGLDSCIASVLLFPIDCHGAVGIHILGSAHDILELLHFGRVDFVRFRNDERISPVFQIGGAIVGTVFAVGRFCQLFERLRVHV